MAAPLSFGNLTTKPAEHFCRIDVGRAFDVASVTLREGELSGCGDNNLRKRIYFSAVTPDLYRPMYSGKVVAFFDKLLDRQFADKPFMRHYLDYYFDLYLDLHLGVTGDAIPPQVREIGEAFNTVLAYRNPLLPVTYDNYMKVRERLDFLKSWIDDRPSVANFAEPHWAHS